MDLATSVRAEQAYFLGIVTEDADWSNEMFRPSRPLSAVKNFSSKIGPEFSLVTIH